MAMGFRLNHQTNSPIELQVISFTKSSHTSLPRFARRIFIGRIPAIFPLIPKNGRSDIIVIQTHDCISYKFWWRDNSRFISRNGSEEQKPF
jgi:hypothetical protein